MAVKKGYKQTEVGVIPEDWEVTQLRNVSSSASGTTPSRSLQERYYRDGTIPWVKTLDLNNSNIHATEERVTSLALRETSLRVHPSGCVLVAMYGGFNQIGRTGLLQIPAAVNQAITAVNPNNLILHPAYLIETLNYRVGYWKSVASSSRKDPNITGKEIREFPLPLPPTLAEQEAIAGALSDADAWIESLEQLIAKKRQIKQGAMQELLTGKRRLPGFSGEWETKRLGKNCRFLRNGTNSRAELTVEGSLKYLHYGDIHSCNSVYMSPITLPSLPVSKGATLDRLQDGDLVLADASEDTTGISKSVEIVNSRGFELVAGLHTIAVRFSLGTFAPAFVGYLQHCPDFNSHLRMLAAGTKVYATNRRHVASAEVSIPPIKEQTAIATVLSDMDTEIESLESKLAKAREIKQGMMQELLTGRIRLI